MEIERVVLVVVEVLLKAEEEAAAARLVLWTALRSPADLNWAVAARAPIWLARRKAFIFFVLVDVTVCERERY